jgi:hypothetical protein
VSPEPSTFPARAERLIPYGVFVAALVFRFLATGALENDLFVMLARANQVVFGELPVRDFVDPGMPLSYLPQAAVGAIFGPTLLTYALVGIVLLAAAAAATFVVARQASGSIWIALAATAVELLTIPRLHNAPKLLVPAVAIALGWGYANRPSPARIVVLSAWTAAAFLFRHDLGLFVAVATTVLVIACHRRQGGELARRGSLYVGSTIVCLLPWLVYVQWAEGLSFYLLSAVRFAQDEASRTDAGWALLQPQQVVQQGLLQVLVFYAVNVLPFAALIVSRRMGSPITATRIAYAATLAVLMNLAFLRDVLAARTADVVVPAVVLGAWLAGCESLTRRSRTLTSTALLVVLVAAAVQAASMRSPVVGPAAIVEQFTRVSIRLSEAAPEITPNPGLAPLIDYIQRCTSPDSRVLVSGFGPEIPVLAHRRFAGGLPTWLPGYYESEPDVERALARVRQESISAAILLDGEDAFATSWPRLADALKSRGFTSRRWPTPQGATDLWLLPAGSTTTAAFCK